MGQEFSRLREKYLSGVDSLTKQESKSMLNDTTTADDSDFNINYQNNEPGQDLLEASKTPPNVMKLKCDPRSPTNFDRTPLKVPLDG